MPVTYAVDASVFLNAFNPREPGSAQSQGFLAHLQSQAIPIIVPTLLLPEVAATLGRGRGDADLANQFVAALVRLPHLVLMPLDTALAQVAADVAARHRLRGSDAVYAAVAYRFGATLVTLDREQHDRVAGFVHTRYPSEAWSEILARA
jgi:predicted nucleic acid-binding protein